MAGNARRGFALMSPERQREIARKGGRAAHERGTAHQFTSDEAREAGRKGGLVVSNDRAHMVEIGRNGGRARRRHRSDMQPGNASSDNEDRSPDSSLSQPFFENNARTSEPSDSDEEQAV